MLTSRGCYGKCSFCGFSSFYGICTGNINRTRKPQNIVDEMVYLVQVHNVTNIYFRDNNFVILSNHSCGIFDKSE